MNDIFLFAGRQNLAGRGNKLAAATTHDRVYGGVGQLDGGNVRHNRMTVNMVKGVGGFSSESSEQIVVL